MALVRYLGPFDQVSLEPANLAPIIVDRGGTVDLPDDLAESLAAQECWEVVEAPKGRKSTTPADPPAAA